MRPRSAAPSARAERGGAGGSAHFAQLVALIGSHAGMAGALITEHSNDETGHCRQCTSGAQAGRHIWPCQTYLAAVEASQVLRRE
jgi:hypothetical protein